MPAKTLDQIALARALKAIERAHRKSNAFDHGGLASHEVMDCLTRELRAEFEPSPAKEKTDAPGD